jgi:hypothetical protein
MLCVTSSIELFPVARCAQDFILHQVEYLSIEGDKWFVEQQQSRQCRQSVGKSDARANPSGELMRTSACSLLNADYICLLFVRPALCLRLPADSALGRTALTFS